jgi:hypothetical protein
MYNIRVGAETEGVGLDRKENAIQNQGEEVISRERKSRLFAYQSITSPRNQIRFSLLQHLLKLTEPSPSNLVVFQTP